MKKILKVISILAYVSKVINAITEGFKVTAANFPTDNPFSSDTILSPKEGQKNEVNV